MRYCEDCRWFDGDGGCDSPRNVAGYTGSSLVQRREASMPYRRWLTCNAMREEGLFWAWFLRMCGRSGRWFEPKEHR